MTNYQGVNLEYINPKRNNYMSLSDLVQDLTTKSLIKILPTLTHFHNQMVIMREIELRNELNEDYFYELMETCNGK